MYNLIRHHGPLDGFSSGTKSRFVTLYSCALAKAEKPDHSRASSSILSLDKSDAPFATQLQEACDLLEIVINDSSKNKSSEEACTNTKSIPFTPRGEFALRWLLKKFQVAEAGPNKYDIKHKVS